MKSPKVALSKEFLQSYAKLPKAQQKKAWEFIEKFRKDPTQSGINFERLRNVKDSKVRSVRIDQAYRAIIVHPPKGDVYLCVWVDHHDEAYDWVKNRRFEVNPKSGVFQFYNKAEFIDPPTHEPVPTEPPRLLANIDDEDLLLGGLPAPLLPSVRALTNEVELDVLAPHLPADCAEMLYLFAAGYGLVEALEELDRISPHGEVSDPEDFAAALDHPDSQRNFKVIGDEEELEAMLASPLEQWRIFLHPSQRSVVQMNAKGPMRVLGGAGTGKTVALLHRAKHLLRKVFTKSDDRLLVTTYTRNLALDLKTQLSSLCGRHAERLEVVNLHSWAVNFMRRHGHSFTVANDNNQRSRLMQEAVNETGVDSFEISFLLDEWSNVVQQQDASCRDDYLTARRVGRERRLGRLQKAILWRVFEEYRQLLDEKGLVEWPDVIRETRLFMEREKIASPYRSVLADEVQDFTAGELRLLHTLGPTSMFLAGDAHQRIYGQPVCLSHCGIEIRGRARRLKVNYRTTAEIRRSAINVLEGWKFDDLDEGQDDLRGYCSLRQGPEPQFRIFDSEAQEAAFIERTLKQWLAKVPSREICLAARTKQLLSSRYQPLLERWEIQGVVIKKEPEAEAPSEGVRVATMHRMKGLEFSRVLVAGVQRGKVPYERALQEASKASELRERCLLYVACTRARDELVLCGFGEPSPFLPASNLRGL